MMEHIMLNVAGLNNIIKHKCIAKSLEILNLDFISIQKTHIKRSEEKYLKNFIWGQIFHVPAKTRTKGVMMRITSYLDFKVELEETDGDVRFIFVKRESQLDAILLVIYVPNEQEQQLAFYQK